MIRWLISLFFNYREILNSQGKCYLRRWYICRWPCKIFLHEILLSDDDRHLHDHPWDFSSIILKGSYREYMFSRIDNRTIVSKVYGWLSRIRHKAEDAHRLENLTDKVVTLVFVGKKRRDWGFYVEDSPHLEYQPNATRTKPNRWCWMQWQEYEKTFNKEI